MTTPLSRQQKFLAFLPVLALFFCLLIGSTWAWIENSVKTPWYIPGLFLLLFGAGLSARTEISRRQALEQRFEDALDPLAPQRRLIARHRARKTNFFLLVLAWGGLAYWLMTHLGQHKTDFFAVMFLAFVAATITLAGILFYLWIRRRLAVRTQQKATAAAKPDIATIALPVPKAAPRIGAAYLHLPTYAQAMLTAPRTENVPARRA